MAKYVDKKKEQSVILRSIEKPKDPTFSTGVKGK